MCQGEIMHEDARDVANNTVSKKSQRNPVKAIRAKCIDCCGAEDYNNRIKDCDITKCALHPFRMGKNPYREKKVVSEEQAAKFKERMRKAWETRRAKQSNNEGSTDV